MTVIRRITLPNGSIITVRLQNDLKVAIIRAGKTNAKVAEEVGVKPQFITDIIKGRKNPSLIRTLMILEAIGKGPGELNDVFWLEITPDEN